MVNGCPPVDVSFLPDWVATGKRLDDHIIQIGCPEAARRTVIVSASGVAVDSFRQMIQVMQLAYIPQQTR